MKTLRARLQDQNTIVGSRSATARSMNEFWIADRFACFADPTTGCECSHLRMVYCWGWGTVGGGVR